MEEMTREPTLMSEQRLRNISKNWIAILISGIFSVFAGILILSVQWSLELLAYVIGAVIATRGLLHLFYPRAFALSSAWNITVGIISMLLGAAIIVFPQVATISVLALAIFIGVWFIAWGVANIASGIFVRPAHHWWLSLVGGIGSIILGVVALYRPVLTLDVAILVAGIWAIVVGATEIGMSFEIRRLPELISSVISEPGTISAIDVQHIERLHDQGLITDTEFMEIKRRRAA